MRHAKWINAFPSFRRGKVQFNQRKKDEGLGSNGKGDLHSFLESQKLSLQKIRKKWMCQPLKTIASRGKSGQNIQLTRQMFWNIKTSLLGQACIARDCGKIEYFKNETCQKERLLLQMWFDLQAFLLLCKSCPLVHNVK